MVLSINNSLVPLTHIEIDNSEANPGQVIQQLKTLMVGQQLVTATKAEKTLQTLRNADQAGSFFGIGSHMHNMAITWFQNNVQTELFAMAFDDGADTAATGTYTVVGTATEDGEIIIYVGGRRIAVPVVNGDDATAMATAISVAVNADTSLPVVGSFVLGVATCTSRQTGLVANQIKIQHGNFEGEDELPAGVTSVTVVPMASGAGTYDIDEIFTAIGDEQFHLFLHSFNDATNIGKFDVALRARNAHDIKKDGYAVTCLSDSVSNIDSAVSVYNSEFNIVLADVNGASDSYQFASALCAQVALEGSKDPARPFQTLAMLGTIAPGKTSRTVIAEQQQLLEAGAATSVVDANGQTRIQRVVMTYKTNEFGAADGSYRDLNTLLTLSTYRSSFDNVLAEKYPRHKLADDGVRAALDPTQAIITPKLAKAEAIAHFIDMEELGLVEGSTQFKASIVVERNKDDVNRLDFLLKPDLINQFRIAGVEIKFLL